MSISWQLDIANFRKTKLKPLPLTTVLKVNTH